MRINQVLLLLTFWATWLAPAQVYSADTTLDQVKLRLVWKNQFQFAGYYMAKEKGFYAEHNLDVEILEADPAIDNLQAITSQQVDFAVGRSSILIAKAKGADIVALFAAFQKSPFMLLTKAFTGIETPADLAGRHIMIDTESEQMGELMSMLIQAGLTTDDYIQQNHSYHINDLVNGNTDAMAAYISNEPYALIQQGIAYNILHPADFGFKMYSDILYTSGKMLREKPQLTKHFYEASIAGWKYALANIPETVAIIHKKYNSQNRSKEALLFEGQELKKLAFDKHGNFGTLKTHRFLTMAQVYLLTGVLKRIPDLNDFIYKPSKSKLNLTYAELAYIKQKQSINICVQKDWPPYEQMDGRKYQGIIADYTKLIRDKTGLSTYPIPTDSPQQALTLTLQGICDITTTANKKTDQGNLLLISDPYISIPLAYASHHNSTAISGQVGFSSTSPYFDMIKNKKTLKKIKTSSLLAGLHLLQNKQIDGMIGSQAHLRYQILNNDIRDLTIADIPDISWQPRFGMDQQHQILNSILDKTIALISKQDHDQIMSRWVVTIPAHQGIDHRVYWALIGFIVLLSTFILYRYFMANIRSQLLQELSETDQLTGIANRRKLLQEIEEYINLSNRYQRELSLIYFDIDDFKQINDHYGHDTGDRVLLEIATLVQQQTRKTDTFGRWGGEEFILASPESTIQDSKKLSTLLQQTIRKHDFKLDRKVTCSFGTTTYKQNEKIDHFINRADQAMYKAKQNGKDCIQSNGD